MFFFLWIVFFSPCFSILDPRRVYEVFHVSLIRFVAELPIWMSNFESELIVHVFLMRIEMLKFLKKVVAGSGSVLKDLPYIINRPYASAWGSWMHHRGASKVRDRTLSPF